jgi:hypothetical protein
MADNKTMEFEAIYGENLKKLMEMLQKEKHTINIEIGGFKPPPGYGAQQGGQIPSAAPDDSTRRNLNMIFQRDSMKYYKMFPDYLKSFKVFSSEMATMSGGMGRIATSLLRFSPIGIAAGAAGMMAGMESASKNVVEDRKKALALGGADVGKLRAAGTVLQNLPINVPDVVGKISDAQYDIRKRTTLMLMGFSQAQIENTDPSDLLMQALTREQKRMKSYKDKSVSMPIEEAIGTEALFGKETLKALGTPGLDLGPLGEQYKTAQKELERTKQTQDAMDEFTRKLSEAGSKICGRNGKCGR